MINYIGRYVLSLIAIDLVQVMILNNINLGGFVNPYLYVLFILILPIEIPNWILIFIAFLLGVLMDVFLNTPGMHASASVFLAFLRPHYLRYLAPREGYEPASLPIPSHFGFSWFFKYVLITVVSHHLFLFFVEAFTFTHFFTTLWKVVVSSLSSIVVILLAEMFGMKKGKRS